MTEPKKKTQKRAVASATGDDKTFHAKELKRAKKLLGEATKLAQNARQTLNGLLGISDRYASQQAKKSFVQRAFRLVLKATLVGVEYVIGSATLEIHAFGPETPMTEITKTANALQGVVDGFKKVGRLDMNELEKALEASKARREAKSTSVMDVVKKLLDAANEPVSGDAKSSAGAVSAAVGSVGKAVQNTLRDLGIEVEVAGDGHGKPVNIDAMLGELLRKK